MTAQRSGPLLVLASLIVMTQGSLPPKIWNDTVLESWATPLARLNVPPKHYTSEEYYRVPADNLRTYPVYPPGREPPGYWEWLQKQKPEPLVDASKMNTPADWVAAGEQAFGEIDFVLARTNDPNVIKRARDPESFKNTFTLADGSVTDPRWVVTSQGLMLTTLDCSSCHRRFDSEKRSISIATPLVPWPSDRPFIRPPGLPITEFFGRMYSRLFNDETFGVSFWRTTAAPWFPEDRVEDLRKMQTAGELGKLFGGNNGGVPRVNGSPFYGAKVPDLHTLRYYRYLDATGTHRLRGPDDVARYIALLSSADPMEFGPHQMLTPQQRRVSYRFADEVLYAIGSYLFSLEPERNPDVPEPAVLETGRQVFERSGCSSCHTPPNYTNGKLTLALGFDPPADHPNNEDLLRISVGTDPGLAMNTRKGTGFYKIPSLRGLWYRPYLLHDGAISSLEELFDSRRLDDNYAPTGWNPPGVINRAVPGHPYGLDLASRDKEALFAFLRSL